MLRRLCKARWKISASVWAVWLILYVGILVGCQQKQTPETSPQASSTGPTTGSFKSANLKPRTGRKPSTRGTATDNLKESRNSSSEGPTEIGGPQQKMLGALLEHTQQDKAFIPTPIDDSKAQALGIRKIEGRHIDLYTDVRDDEVESYVQAFDLAVPQWAAYFGVENPGPEAFHVRGCLIFDQDRFRAAGLLPANIPPFLHGYQDNGELWVYPQPGDYFTRHLILHEGTHAFMRRVLQGSGPPWYMEGIAELLATHRWENGKLQLKQTLMSKDEAPYWGRVKIVRDEFAAGRALSLESIMKYGWRAHLQTEPYGWSWAACAFFDGSPEYQPVFRQLHQQVSDRTITFSQKFIDRLPGDWNQVTEQWQLFTAEMDYGYDHERAAIEYRPTQPLEGEKSLAIQANRGWQSSGLRLDAGKRYRVVAEGDFTLGQVPKPWRSEANGITIHYHQGRPLGILLGAIRDENSRLEGLTPLATPFVIGQDLEISPEKSGTLFLRINDAPSALSDNTGELNISVRIIRP